MFQAEERPYENNPNVGRERGRGRSRGRGANANQASQASAFVCITANEASTNQSKWLFDSATTDHIVNHSTFLHDARPFQSTCTVANKQTAAESAIGTVKLTNHLGQVVTLKNVLVVPTLQHNLMSLSNADEACRTGMSYSGGKQKIILRSQTRQLLLGKLNNGLYEVLAAPTLSGADPAINTSLVCPADHAHL